MIVEDNLSILVPVIKIMALDIIIRMGRKLRRIRINRKLKYLVKLYKNLRINRKVQMLISNIMTVITIIIIIDQLQAIQTSTENKYQEK
mgnify:FL=1